MSASLKTIELEISLAIRKAIETKTLDSSSAMTLIHKGMNLLSNYQNLKGSEKKQILLNVLEHVSAGSDGILGTADDLLPASTLKAIKAIMEGDLVGDIVDTFVAITKGAPVDTQKLISIGARLKVAITACFKGTKIQNNTINHSDDKPLPFMKPGLVPERMNLIHNELWIPAPKTIQEPVPTVPTVPVVPEVPTVPTVPVVPVVEEEKKTTE